MPGSENITNSQEASVTAPASSSKIAHRLQNMRFLKPSLSLQNLSWLLVNWRWKPSLGIALLVRDLVHQQCYQNRAQSFVGTCAFQPFKKIQKAGQNRPDLPVSVGDKTGSLPNLGEMLPCSTEAAVRKTKHPFKQGFFMVILEGK